MAVVSLSIFLPCYNEASNVELVVRAAVGAARGITRDFEVIIVDDGSSDGTAEIADRLAIAEDGVRAVHHEINRGYGAALRTGFRSATKEWVFFTDADGQFDLSQLVSLVPLTDRCDMVACFRTRRRDPWHRRLNAWAWNRLVGLLFDLRIRDVNCAFKLCRREILDSIPLESEGALISTELLARVHRAGYRIVQMGVTHYPRAAGKQTGASPRVVLRAFRELFRLRRRILSGVSPSA